jgi:hypothetical protein
MPEFDDLKAWPADHNQPPLLDRVLIDFDDALRMNGLDVRIAEVTGSADRAPELDTPEAVGKAGDLIAQARAVREKVGTERDELNGPLVEATKALKAKQDAVLAPMESAIAGVQARLDAYMAEHPDDRVRGDFGALVSGKTAWRAEIVNFAKLPLAIRRHPDVVAAAEKVIRAMVRGGDRTIPGARIWPETTANVR